MQDKERENNMLKNDIYAIYTNDDDRRGSIKELFYSFNDAMEARYCYANWYCEKGDIWIKQYKANTKFSCSHSWHINKNGNIISEYNF